MKDLVEKDFWVKKELRKHRYIYLLGSKSEKRITSKKPQTSTITYPKTAGYEKWNHIWVWCV